MCGQGQRTGFPEAAGFKEQRDSGLGSSGRDALRVSGLGFQGPSKTGYQGFTGSMCHSGDSQGLRGQESQDLMEQRLMVTMGKGSVGMPELHRAGSQGFKDRVSEDKDGQGFREGQDRGG